MAAMQIDNKIPTRSDPTNIITKEPAAPMRALDPKEGSLMKSEAVSNSTKPTASLRTLHDKEEEKSEERGERNT